MADEVVAEFLVESDEGLERIEQDLVTLEAEPTNQEVIDRIFRDVHTIKGVSGFLGFSHLEAITHAGESLLSKVRAGEITVTAPVVSALLATVDAIRTMLESVKSTDGDGDNPFSEVVAQLKQLLAQSKSPNEDAQPADADDAVPTLGEVLIAQGIADREAVEDALKSQDAGDPRRLGEILVRREAVRPADVERALETQKAAKKQLTTGKDATIRVSVDLLDRLMNLVGELVLVRNQILQTTFDAEDSVAASNAHRLNLVTTELQEGVMKTRMQQIGTVWGPFPRIVRDLARSCEKQMHLEMHGRETELDKTILEAIKDPLTHLVRNACDHGMETPAQREKVGKPAEGVLSVRAYHEGGQVVIEVADDGRSIDPEAIRNKATDKGVLPADQIRKLSDQEALNLIFMPGFSTAETVTNVSGRGVGMDVVKTNIEKIGGTVELSSTLGAGTTIQVRIPLTLAIIPALIVRCGGDCYAIPQVSLVELVLLEGEERRRIELVHGAPVYRLRGKLLPLVFLSEELGVDEGMCPTGAALNIVVLQANGQQFGLVVEGVRDTEEIVVKPLGKELKALTAYAGATIMGDGSVALILDVAGLARMTGIVAEGNRAGPPDERAEPTDRALSDAETLLLFESAGEAPIAIELTQIDRLEEFSPDAIERAGGRDVVQYRGRIMPVIHLAHTLYGQTADDARRREDDEAYQVIVVRRGSETFGVVVGRLIDIVEIQTELRPVGQRPGIRGTSVVDGRVVERLNVDAVLKQAVPELWSQCNATGEA